MTRKERGLSSEQKRELWRRWKEGQSLNDIGRALGKFPASIRGVVSAQGGLIPVDRRRSRLALTLAEREDISRGLAAGSSLRAIAAKIGRAASTLSREVARHGGRESYRASCADTQAWANAKRPKPCLLAGNRRLQRLVAGKLRIHWSPEQISDWLRLHHRGNEAMQVSHETIYRSLFIQARGVLKKELLGHLRTGRKFRRSKHAGANGDNRGKFADVVSISERPAEAEDRAVPGHWEGDLISGSNNSHIATLVERRSRYALLIKVNGKDTASVVSALSRHVRKLPAHLRKSLTWDRGKEMASHKDFTVATDVKVYFCDPQSPWQRGTNENTNGLLRQYFPKGTDLSVHSQSKLDKVARELNQRPRKTLGFITPAEKLSQTVATTG
jgi:IS30 family transposase